jgi:hypothetical protein
MMEIRFNSRKGFYYPYARILLQSHLLCRVELVGFLARELYIEESECQP